MARKAQEKTTLKTATMYVAVTRDNGNECGCEHCKHPDHGNVEVEIQDAQGNTIHNLDSSCSEGADVINALNLKDAPDGRYRLTITGETGSPSARRRKRG